MPSWGDVLLTIAQIAVAFAGFTGLIGLFITRNEGVMARREIPRFRMMLDYSLITLLAALFPFPPAALELSSASLWRISSIALLIGLAGYWLFVGRILLRSADQGVSRGLRWRQPSQGTSSLRLFWRRPLADPSLWRWAAFRS